MAPQETTGKRHRKPNAGAVCAKGPWVAASPKATPHGASQAELWGSSPLSWALPVDGSKMKQVLYGVRHHLLILILLLSKKHFQTFCNTLFVVFFQHLWSPKIFGEVIRCWFCWPQLLAPPQHCQPPRRHAPRPHWWPRREPLPRKRNAGSLWPLSPRPLPSTQTNKGLDLINLTLANKTHKRSMYI